MLAGSITENGGTIMKKSEVTDFYFDSDSIKSVEINHSDKIEGKYFISNINPKTMLRISANIPLRQAYKKRINSIEDTHGIFTLYLAMKKNAFKYINSNLYVYKTKNVWECARYNQENWPLGYMMSISPGSGNDEYTDAIMINTYMNWKDVSPWEDTTVEKRGEDYIAFKRQKAEKLLDVLETDFPGIRSKIEAYYTSTPLTYRDYTGTSKGSMYGLLKDYNDPLKTMILPRTHVRNLFLTGQSINIHGVMGVTLGSILTCSELIGSQYLLNKLQNA
jgi:all-trans-retinol 13,14-reductase